MTTCGPKSVLQPQNENYCHTKSVKVSYLFGGFLQMCSTFTIVSQPYHFTSGLSLAA